MPGSGSYPLRVRCDSWVRDFGLEVLWQHATLVSVEDRVRLPAGPLNEWGRMFRGGESALQADWMGSTPIVSIDNGPVVQRDDASLACWQCGFDSRRVHWR